jgi:hypothetical protein
MLMMAVMEIVIAIKRVVGDNDDNRSSNYDDDDNGMMTKVLVKLKIVIAITHIAEDASWAAGQASATDI